MRRHERHTWRAVMEASPFLSSVFWSHFGNIRVMKIHMISWILKTSFLASFNFPKVGSVYFFSFKFFFILFFTITWSSLVTSYIFLLLILEESCSPRKTNKQKWQGGGGGRRYKKKKTSVTSIYWDSQLCFPWAGSQRLSGAWATSFFVVFVCLFLWFFFLGKLLVC